MFPFLSEMFTGQHDELPRRRSVNDAIQFDRALGDFVQDHTVAPHDGEWLHRGEVPGARHVREAAAAPGVQTVAEEMLALATKTAPKPSSEP